VNQNERKQRSERIPGQQLHSFVEPFFFSQVVGRTILIGQFPVDHEPQQKPKIKDHKAVEQTNCLFTAKQP
jgi:hypothetical protein